MRDMTVLAFFIEARQLLRDTIDLPFPADTFDIHLRSTGTGEFEAKCWRFHSLADDPTDAMIGLLDSLRSASRPVLPPSASSGDLGEVHDTEPAPPLKLH